MFLFYFNGNKTFGDQFTNSITCDKSNFSTPGPPNLFMSLFFNLCVMPLWVSSLALSLSSNVFFLQRFCLFIQWCHVFCFILLLSRPLSFHCVCNGLRNLLMVVFIFTNDFKTLFFFVLFFSRRRSLYENFEKFCAKLIS